MLKKSHVLAVAALAALYKIGSILCARAILAKALQRIPGSEKGWLGQISELIANRDRLKEYLLQYKSTHAPNSKTFRFQTPANNVIVVTSPENVRHILRDNMKNYIKGPSFTERFEDLLGDGIFNTNGESWSLQRKVASKIFTGSNFNSFFQEVFYKHGKTVLELLDDYASFGGTTYGRTIDMQQVFFNYTLESMGEIGFGVELGCLTSKASPFSEAFDAAQALTMARVFDPMWKLKRALCIGKNERELYDALKTVDNFSHEVIADRRRELEHHSAVLNDSRGDLLSLFVEAGQKLKEKNKLEAASKVVGDKFLRDMIINMLIAGRDTTACTLTWTTYLISQHPEIEEHLLHEIRNMTDGREEVLTSRDLSAEKMPYLHGIVSEALRLYPPVPTDLKCAVENDVLPDGTMVPAGVDVQYNPYIQNRDPDLWENPMIFNPSRWMDEDGKTVSVCPFKFPVFQAGPRLCLGQRMAYFEAKLLLTMLLPRFKFVLEPGAVIRPNQASITLSVKESLPMKILKRDIAEVA